MEYNLLNTNSHNLEPLFGTLTEQEQEQEETNGNSAEPRHRKQ